MKVVLAEKPSVARELAVYLGAGSRQDGYFEGQGWQVTWALGHLVTLKEPDELNPAWKKWDLEALPLAPQKFELKVVDTPQARKQFAVVKRLLRGASEIIGATDAGREGELILRYILEMAGCARRPLRRLWLSSLTRQAIADGFSRLRPGADFDPLYDAARCRSEADWLVGMNATRALTVKFGKRGLLWSAGRVQTPVLAMIVHRDDEIRAFKSEPFFEVLTKFRKAVFKHTAGRFATREEAEQVMKQAVGKEFVVVKVQKKRETSLPPLLFDLTELQREMNRRYGMTADQTLKAAQSLYEKQFITYPRTDSRYLTSDAKKTVPGVLRNLQAIRADEIAQLDLSRLRFNARIINDKKVGDHHAILPTGKIPGSLSSQQQRVFDAVVTRLIAAFYPPCEKEVVIVDGEASREPFRARGVRVVSPGWTALYPKPPATGDDQQPLPEFSRGDRGPHEPSVREGKTAPPKPHTEHSLLGAMETAGRMVDEEELQEALKERGLGTPATRAAIIETLLTRNYIRREKKTLIATDLGRCLVALVHDERLKSPELTGHWEQHLKEMEAGQHSRKAFMLQTADYVKRLVQLDVPIDESIYGACPRCGAAVIKGRRDFGCSAWRSGCKFVLSQNYRGQTFSEEQVRRLLQRGVLLEPVTLKGEQRLVYLSSQGAVMDVPLPAPATQKSFKKRSYGKGKKGAGRSRRSAASSSKEGAGRSVSKDPLGPCPLCGADVCEQSKSFSCSKWKDGCSFTIWKKIAGKTISRRTAATLINSGKSSQLKGFKSKAGKSFDARLVLTDGEVRFEFVD